MFKRIVTDSAQVGQFFCFCKARLDQLSEITEQQRCQVTTEVGLEIYNLYLPLEVDAGMPDTQLATVRCPVLARNF